MDVTNVSNFTSCICNPPNMAAVNVVFAHQVIKIVAHIQKLQLSSGKLVSDHGVPFQINLFFAQASQRSAPISEIKSSPSSNPFSVN